MKRLAIILAMTSTSLMANPQVIIGQACNDTECVDIEIDRPSKSYEMLSTEAPKTGKGKSRFVQIVSVLTGEAVDGVSVVVETISDSMVASGYHEFHGELSGPAGSVNFSYNFKTGAWSISSKGNNGGGKRPKKQRN